MTREKIDLHLIMSGNEKEEWIDECFNSLKNEPVNIYTVDHIEGNVGKSRANGYMQGNSRYVSSLDPDDFIVEGTFHRALKYLIDGWCTTYYTNHYILYEMGKVSGTWFKVPAPQGILQDKQMHHVIVYDRDTIEDSFDYLDGVQQLENRLINYYAIRNGTVYTDGHIGAYWRQHDNNGRKKFNSHNNPLKWKMETRRLREELFYRAV